jgi:Kinesin-associated protein (KAP)
MIYKIQGTAQILSLCTQVSNLEHLVQDQTLMGALTRVLNEEYKKSVVLCYNIMRAFLAFSNFAEMHPILANFRVGNITMKVCLNIYSNATCSIFTICSAYSSSWYSSSLSSSCVNSADSCYINHSFHFSLMITLDTRARSTTSATS